jgi:hypothetical protein
MTLLPLPSQTLAWLNLSADAGQRDAQALLHLLARADARDQDDAKFLDSYSRTIAALCRRLEALERGAKDLPTPAASTPLPSALVERVASAMGPSTQAAMDAGDLPFGAATIAICEVAAWLDTRGQHRCSVLLREEIDR